MALPSPITVTKRSLDCGSESVATDICAPLTSRISLIRAPPVLVFFFGLSQDFLSLAMKANKTTEKHNDTYSIENFCVLPLPMMAPVCWLGTKRLIKIRLALGSCCLAS